MIVKPIVNSVRTGRNLLFAWIGAAGVLAGLSQIALAGPPFLTDDPEPVELHHWEFYIGSQTAINRHEQVGTAPHFEINYGAFPETQLHLITPFVYSAAEGEPTRYGYGDTEIGVKYRFIKETDTIPQVGVFPLLEVPTGDQDRGLGNGKAQAFLPLWVQKSFGKWTTYGGGGYWINPGPDHKNYWFTAWQLQRKITDNLTLGGEVYNFTPTARGEQDRVGFNLGGIFDITEHHHLLFSVGHDIQGPNAVIAYLAYQVTF